jgi:hypothetical protein
MALEGIGRGGKAAEALRDAAAAYHRGGDGDGEADAHLRLGHLSRREGLLRDAADASTSTGRCTP